MQFEKVFLLYCTLDRVRFTLLLLRSLAACGNAGMPRFGTAPLLLCGAAGSRSFFPHHNMPTHIVDNMAPSRNHPDIETCSGGKYPRGLLVSTSYFLSAPAPYACCKVQVIWPIFSSGRCCPRDDLQRPHLDRRRTHPEICWRLEQGCIR